MRTKTRYAKDRCVVCGGRLRSRIDEATLREVDRLLRQGEPGRTLETPVYDFAAAGMK